MTANQSYLFDAYVIGDGDFTDVVCEDCASKFATEHGLIWNLDGKKPYTTEEDESSAYAYTSPWSLGESDSPYSCCGSYLKTDFTSDGENYLRENFPQWVQDLYLA